MHFTWLRAQRAKMDEGMPLDQLVNSARPPIHFSRKAKVQTQIRTWSANSLATACTRIYDAIAQTRKNAALDSAHTRQALLAIATIAARH
jgi:DNA polymerase-3 subunit delta